MAGFFLNETFKLYLQIIHGLINGFDRPDAAFRLFNLEIDSRVVLHANDSQKSSDSLGRVSASSDYFTHIRRVCFESYKNSHFVNLSVNADRGRIVNYRFNDVFKKFFVSHFISVPS